MANGSPPLIMQVILYNTLQHAAQFTATHYSTLQQTEPILNVHSTGGGDQTSNNYNFQKFKQVFTGVPAFFKKVFTRTPELKQVFTAYTGIPVTQKSGQENCPIWRSKYFKSELLHERILWKQATNYWACLWKLTCMIEAIKVFGCDLQ